ncbi:MAG: hypothetical protein EOO46_05140 [Flavobacterium sp.]|nr:MAG: hypothetical protein EOO46_05140 [Flavobacterium sp.]
MATNRTFTMIKPDAVANGHIGNILAMITNGGFKIVSLKLTQLTVADAQAFYAVHSARPFYGELVEFMSRGPIVAAILINKKSHFKLKWDFLFIIYSITSK